MHVLSLPPAFVLSQDQTLKLRIQSRHNHVVVLLELNGRSSPSKHSRKSIRKRRERLYFHSKNVTVEVYSMNNLKAETLQSSAQLPPPTFLFLIFNCQKTDRDISLVISQTPQSLSPNTPQNLAPKSPGYPPKTSKPPAKSRNFRASSSVASSAAALVGVRFIDPTAPLRQQGS